MSMPAASGVSRTRLPVLDIHELAGGKLAALLSRRASRDLFDTCQLLRRSDLDPAKLRLAFVVYGAASRRDWRTVAVDDVKGEAAELQRRLLPTLRGPGLPSPGAATRLWLEELVGECRDRLSLVLPLTGDEREFIARLNDDGEIYPELLGVDRAMQELLRAHPALQWKALNVRGHRGTARE